MEADFFRDFAAAFARTADGEPVRLALQRLPALRRSSVTHTGRRWRRYLLFQPGKARLLGWFGALAERLDLPDAEQSAAHVLAHLWHRPAESEADWDVMTAGLSVTAEHILVAAFLADLAQAYRRRRRRRRLVHCALLIDDADLLTPDDSSQPAFRGAGPARSRPDTLGLLAEGKRLYPDVPLLVVATKQDAPPADQAARLLDGELDPERAAAETYAEWRRRHDPRKPDTALLHVPLAPFDELGTARYVGVWAGAQNRMTRTAERTAELHQVSRGHPRALWLLAEALVLRSDWASAVPAVRSLLKAPVPPAVEALGGYDNIAEAVLHGFLQRFVDDESGDRSQTRQWLRRLSAARFIDVSIIELLLDATDARRFWAELARYSMVTRQRNGRLVLHPLLRDLLQLDLLENAPVEYDDTHVALLRHFQARARTGEPVADEVLYHYLALGDQRPLVRAVASWISGSDRPPGWLPSIVDAPGRNAGEPAARPDDSASFDTRVRYLVTTLRRLLSISSAERWTAELLGEVDDAHRAALAAKHPADPPSPRDRLLTRTVNRGAPAPPAIPPASGRARLPYPHSRLYRHRRKLAVPSLLVLLAVAAGGYVQFDTYWANHCRRSSFGFGRQVWLATLGSDNLVLDRRNADQCVGLTDQAGSLLYSGRLDSTTAGAEIAYIYQKIIDENGRVEREAQRTGKPVATIAVAAILTSDQDGRRRDLYGGLNELRGAYLAQRQWNRDRSPEPSNSFYIRLLLANFGHDANDAAVSAQPLRDEPDILAVTGLGQTRDTTIKTVDALRLGDDPIPAVSSALSGDAFTRRPGFLRVGPPNARLAQVGVQFIKLNFNTSRPFVLFNRGDAYSNNLKADYLGELKSARSEQLSHPVPLEFDVATAKKDLEDIADEVCNSTPAAGAKRLVLYLGRAYELFTLLRSLDDRSCLAQTVILGDDDLTDVEADGFTDLLLLANYSHQLYFTTFGPAENDRRAITSNPKTKDFFDYYNTINEAPDGQAYKAAANGHVALAYDAVNLVADTIDKYWGQFRHLPSRRELLQRLQETKCFPGAAGTVTIDTTNRVDPVDKQVVVQQVNREGNSLNNKDVFSDAGSNSSCNRQ